PQPRHLVTGAHTVADIRCTICKSYLGWKYVDAEEEAQKYKIGKFILEGNRVITGVDWEGSDCRNTEEEEIGGREGIGGMRDRRVKEGEEAVEFDSEDEDECEDLFAGVWSPKLAKWRR
ncbi:yippee-domain-containing protein, partial [Delitschia confertaspora ATCC 74209]